MTRLTAMQEREKKASENPSLYALTMPQLLQEITTSRTDMKLLLEYVNAQLDLVSYGGPFGRGKQVDYDAAKKRFDTALAALNKEEPNS